MLRGVEIFEKCRNFEKCQGSHNENPALGSLVLPNAKRMCKRMLETGQEFEFENWPEEVKMAHISHKYGHCRMMMHLMLLDVRTGAYADHRPRHSTYTEIFAGMV